ncbi:UNVERIFIED_CONTAM: hypothetical protein GTU68_008800 [Idotea baltica]|nr:hypothetical protein [Idotea baltica]
MVIESIDVQSRQETLAGLAIMMELIQVVDGQYQTLDKEPLTLSSIEARFSTQILANTLIRRIEPFYVDVDAAHWQKNIQLNANESNPIRFKTTKKQLPDPIPNDWQIETLNEQEVQVTLTTTNTFKVDSYRKLHSKSAGQLPSGFDLSKLYNTHFHPRGLQMTIAGANDALHSIGIDWDIITQHVEPTEIAVFSGSIMSQLDENGYGGLMQSRLKGRRVSAKQLPLGFNSMPTDFINAYILGSVGTAGTTTGACATFLYNLKQGIEQIQLGKSRVVLVGNSEAPIIQECLEGYDAMGALATEEGLCNIDNTESTDFQKSCRPFGKSCGFTLAESSQYIILMDDALALELGAQIFAAVPDVFINTDGFKRSISSPGAGNLLSMMQAVSSAVQLLGEEAIQERSFVQAHGSGTPANRTTESELLNRVAQTFNIQNWPITATKAFVGHSLATAAGDQVMSALGTFKYNIIPGIKTVDKIADDVTQQNLQFNLHDQIVKPQGMDVCFINAKGFGGNNASGVVLAPHVVDEMLQKRYGDEKFLLYCEKRKETYKNAEAYDARAQQGLLDVHYHFGKNIIDEQAIICQKSSINIPGFKQSITLKKDTRYSDMLKT